MVCRLPMPFTWQRPRRREDFPTSIGEIGVTHPAELPDR